MWYIDELRSSYEGIAVIIDAEQVSDPASYDDAVSGDRSDVFLRVEVVLSGASDISIVLLSTTSRSDLDMFTTAALVHRIDISEDETENEVIQRAVDILHQIETDPASTSFGQKGDGFEGGSAAATMQIHLKGKDILFLPRCYWF